MKELSEYKTIAEFNYDLEKENKEKENKENEENEEIFNNRHASHSFLNAIRFHSIIR